MGVGVAKPRNGVKMIDGEAVELLGVGFAGAKGFAGGFGRGTLSAFGEPAMKAFVKEAMVVSYTACEIRARSRPLTATLFPEPPPPAVNTI